MRFLIVDTYYPRFLSELYRTERGLADRPYAEQWRRIMDECFGTADYYSRNLARLGHEAVEVVANCEPLQHRWASEHGVSPRRRLRWRTLRGVRLPWYGRDWAPEVLLAQVRSFRPDVVHFQDPAAVPAGFLRELRPHARLITGQIASPLPAGVSLRGFDLMLSSLPNFVERFRRMGLRSEYFRLGFEPAVLQRLEAERRHDVVFVGGLSREHGERVRFLEQVARSHPLAWWGYGAESLPAGSPLREAYRGPAWGLEMYGRLREARIALNHHIDIAEEFANNMRLYEATGVGALLLTDWKANLETLFRVPEEVAAYRSPEECVELVGHYLERSEEREAVAAAGQRRTLAEHSYLERMRELAGLAERLA